MSPIPLGILAAAGGAAGPAFEHIETVNVGAGGVAEIQFNNLSTYSSTYKHLQIRAVARSTNTAATRNMVLRFNGVTTASYAFQFLTNNGSLNGLAAGSGGSQTSLNVGQIFAVGNGTTNLRNPIIIEIVDAFETDKIKTVRSYGGSPHTDNAAARSGLFGGFWSNNNAISSISIRNDDLTSNFAQFSSFALYGLKGQ